MPPNRGTDGGTGWREKHPSPGSPSLIPAGQPDFIGVKCPAFKSKFIRLQTFSSGTGWPTNKTQTPDEIAEVGLFFAGKGDCTKCFCCGIGLRNWLPGDIPAVEHARWEPGCLYIRWLKGEEFVDNVDENYPRIVILSPRNGNTSLSTSNTSNPTPNRKEIVDSVMMKPGAHALRRYGYSDDVIRNAISKVLSENGWDENIVTTNQLALAVLNLSEERKERNNSSDTTTGELRNRVTESARSTINDGDSDGIPSPPNSLTDSDDEFEKLAAENLRMKTTLTCKICLDATVSVLFLPCGHVVTCSACASRQRKCPICRSKIATLANVHLSNPPIENCNVN